VERGFIKMSKYERHRQHGAMLESLAMSKPLSEQYKYFDRKVKANILYMILFPLILISITIWVSIVNHIIYLIIGVVLSIGEIVRSLNNIDRLKKIVKDIKHQIEEEKKEKQHDKT